MKLKDCTKCGEQKKFAEFSKDNNQSSGLRPDCKKCVSKYYYENKSRINKNHKIWRNKNIQKLRNKDLKNKYNITLNDYDKLLREQSSKCAICNKKEIRKANNGKIKRLAIDHNHKTGKVRRLLCQKCNSALGYVNEDIDILQTMIKYLRKYQ